MRRVLDAYECGVDDVKPSYFKLALGAIAVSLLIFGWVKRDGIRLQYELFNLERADTFEQRLLTADRIGELVKEHPRFNEVIMVEVLQGDWTDQNRGFLASSLFVEPKSAPGYLDQLYPIVSGDACKYAGLISYLSRDSFEHGITEYGWKFYDLVDGCALKCSPCLDSAMAILIAIPTAQLAEAKEKVKALSTQGDEARKRAGIVDQLWVHSGKTTTATLSEATAGGVEVSQ